MSPRSSYHSFQSARRPSGKPRTTPRYRVLVRRQYAELWEQLPDRVGLEAAQQFYDYVANTPGQPPAVGTTTILKGSLGKPIGPGFSRTIHYEVSGAGGLTSSSTTRRSASTATPTWWSSS